MNYTFLALAFMFLCVFGNTKALLAVSSVSLSFAISHQMVNVHTGPSLNFAGRWLLTHVSPLSHRGIQKTFCTATNTTQERQIHESEEENKKEISNNQLQPLPKWNQRTFVTHDFLRSSFHRKKFIYEKTFSVAGRFFIVIIIMNLLSVRCTIPSNSHHPLGTGGRR